MATKSTKARTVVTITVQGIEERIDVGSAQSDSEVQAAVGRYFMETFRTLIDTRVDDPAAADAVAADVAAREAAATPA